jgi:hypothetical protein
MDPFVVFAIGLIAKNVRIEIRCAMVVHELLILPRE